MRGKKTATKKQNVVTKFQEFWETISHDERNSLWHVLTSLRGPDNSKSGDQMKDKTTVFVRGALLGQHGNGYVGGCTVLIPPDKLTVPDFNTIEEECGYHFAQHLLNAVDVLQKCGFKWKISKEKKAAKK